uniref:Perilipin n=1 Tax=Gopherus evgoodei TaxID=1825980 RepID=A0A8C4VMW3_9SAUR
TPFCMSGNRSEIQAACPEPQGQEHQVVGRVAGLPLVRSACEMASASYAATKETHQAVKAVCEVAETGVRAITSAAITGAQPILDQLDSQIAAANEYACKGLDTLEEKLPVLQQTVQKVASDAQDLVHAAVAEARDAVCSMAGETKDTVTSMVGVAKGAVQESMEMTKSNYFLRLGSLSTKLRQRAYQHALGKMRQARQHTLEAISQLQQTIDLMEHAKQAVSQKVHDGQEKLQQMWLEWHKGQLGGSEDDSSPQPELQISFSNVQSFQELSEGILTQTREKVTKAQESLDELLEYVVQNAPLTWIVEPFAPAGDSAEPVGEPAEEKITA